MIARLFARLALAVGLVALAILFRPGGPEPAEAQGVSVSIEFREALSPHGRWHRHARWGEVWIPARVDREWRPYTRGRWVYTDDWGWYWVSDEDWGWVAYHYGRWVFDPEVGWFWIPGNEWGPAWVSWRRGGEEIGWAPLPPDDYVKRIDDDPNVWIFVRARDVIAPSIARVLLPRPRATVLVRQTVIVNRTVYVSGAGVAANAGVPPSYIAARTGRAIRVSQVQPVVVRGTVGVSGAVEVDVRDKGAKQRRKAEVKQAARSIQPAKEVPAPKRFERGTVQETPDAPKVLRQAQPETQQKQDDTQKQKRDDDAPKQDAPKADPQKRDDTKQDTPKAEPQKRDDMPKRQDAPKAEPQKRDDMPKRQDAPKTEPQKRDDVPKRQDAPKAEPQKRDNGPRGDEQQKRDLPQKRDAGPKNQQQERGPQPKQDAAPKEQRAPERQQGPAKGPGPGPKMDKKEN
jgi:hypothetical protein